MKLKQIFKKSILSMCLGIILFGNLSPIISFASTEEVDKNTYTENQIQYNKGMEEISSIEEEETQEEITNEKNQEEVKVEEKLEETEEISEEQLNNVEEQMDSTNRKITDYIYWDSDKEEFIIQNIEEVKRINLAVADITFTKEEGNIPSFYKPGYTQNLRENVVVTFIDDTSISQSFRIGIKTIDTYIKVDTATGDVAISNIDQIQSITIGEKTFTKEEENIPSVYNLTSGTWTISIINTNNQEYSNEYTINKKCSEFSEDQIEYFDVSLFDYNPEEFNMYARNMSSTDFYNLNYKQRGDIDSKLTLLGKANASGNYLNDSNRYYACNYGGVQNGILNINGNYTNASAFSYFYGATQGRVEEKLLNNQVVLKNKNYNNLNFFPTEAEAEGRDLVGNGKPFQEILRDYKLPLIQDSSGYYSFDSNLYHAKVNNTKNIEIHEGQAGGLNEVGSRRVGFFPFNEECYQPIEATQEYNNNAFGMRMDVNFYMTQDGKTKNLETGELEDITFKFRGDDDVWVFVDGNLVLDLGGSHTAVSGSINFAQNTNYVDLIWDKTGSNNYNDYSNTLKDITTTNIFGEKILSEGNHTLTIFYMETWGSSSNLYINFNLPQNENDIKGTVEFKDGNNLYNTRPKQYTVKLYADGEYLTEQTLTNLENTNSYIFKNLNRLTNGNTGTVINYTIEVSDILLENGDKYVISSQYGIYNQFITLTLTGTTSITVKKEWEDRDNKYNTRPDKVKLQLLTGKVLTYSNNGIINPIPNKLYISSNNAKANVENGNWKIGYTSGINGNSAKYYIYLKSPDGTVKQIKEGDSLPTEPGSYFLACDGNIKYIEIIDSSSNNYYTYNSNNSTIKLKNIQNIESIEIGNNIYSKDEIPLYFTFTTRGIINIIINFYNPNESPSVIFNCRVRTVNYKPEEIYYNYFDT